jgi:hypothetical protein
LLIKKIISCAQTGADRAGLDFAIEVGSPHGVWVPKGLKAEDGTIPVRYNIQEMPTSSYPARTEKNILDSHGTLIISHGKLTGGSLRTKKLDIDYRKVSGNWLSMKDVAFSEEHPPGPAPHFGPSGSAQLVFPGKWAFHIGHSAFLSIRLPYIRRAPDGRPRKPCPPNRMQTVPSRSSLWSSEKSASRPPL